MGHFGMTDNKTGIGDNGFKVPPMVYVTLVAAWAFLLVVFCSMLWLGRNMQSFGDNWLPSSESEAYSSKTFVPVRNEPSTSDDDESDGHVFKVQGSSSDGTTAEVDVSSGTVYFHRGDDTDVKRYASRMDWIRYAKWTDDISSASLEIGGSDDCGKTMCKDVASHYSIIGASWGK